MEKEYQLSEGSLTYVRQGNGLEITQYHGLAGSVVIPEELPWGEDVETVKLPVTSLAKKVFLSKKYLRSVSIPKSVESVGDWAFAYCDSLREVSFGNGGVHFGKDIFKECGGLRFLRFPAEKDDQGEHGEEMSASDGLGALMASAVTQMDASYLLDGREAGSKEWLEKWDARMMAILHAGDDEGYSKQILCGEEDYESADQETYQRNSRKKKVRLLLLRLLYPMGLAPERAELLREYLLAHTLGSQTDETWQVVRTEYGDRREFYELFAKLGCLTKENVAEVIAQTGEEHPEMKAYFLKYQADHFPANDFFDDLAL